MDEDEVRMALEANFRPRVTTFPAGSVKAPGADDAVVLTSSDALSLAARKVLRVLASNILSAPQEVKYRAIRRTQPWLTFALDNVQGTPEWLRFAGFVYDGQSDKYCFALSTEDEGLARLKVAVALLDATVEAAESANVATEVAKPAPPPTLLVSKRKQAADEEAARRAAEADALRAALRRDQEAREAEARELAAALEAAIRGRDEDFAAAAVLVETARRTLHFTGRLRNSLFEACDFSLRVMRHGRHFACGGASFTATAVEKSMEPQSISSEALKSCPDDCLEAHWHVAAGNLIYAFVAHLSPDASQVLHVGPELGYQYNAIPHTEHFQRFLHTSFKLSDVNGKLIRNESPNVVASHCQYCTNPLSKFLR